MSSAIREENRQVALILTNILGTSPIYPTGVVLTNSTPMHVAMVDSSGSQVIPNSLNLKPYDYVSMALSNANQTETYTFKTGGSSGTTTNTVVIVYTDNTRTVISTVTKT